MQSEDDAHRASDETAGQPQAPPEVQLPPPAPAEQPRPPAPVPASSGPSRATLIAAIVVLTAMLAAIVLVLAGREGDDAPSTAATQTATSVPTQAPTVTGAPTQAPPEAAPPPPPEAPSSTGLRGTIADRVGPFQLSSIDEGDVLIDDEGASEAYTMEYETAGGGSLSHQAGVLASPEAAEALVRKRVAERKGFGARVVSEEPYGIGDQRVGIYFVTKEDNLYLALWSNGPLFATALAGREDRVRAFVAAAPY